MNFIISLLSTHLLSAIENELLQEEPAIIEIAVKEVELLISKLENLIVKKSPTAAAILEPVLTQVGKTAINMVQASGEAAVASVSAN